MNCPECGKKMDRLDNTTFQSDDIMTQLFGFTPTNYGCFDCNIAVPIPIIKDVVKRRK